MLRIFNYCTNANQKDNGKSNRNTHTCQHHQSKAINVGENLEGKDSPEAVSGNTHWKDSL